MSNYSNYDQKKAEEIKALFPEAEFTDYQLSVLTDDDDWEDDDEEGWDDFDDEEGGDDDK